MIDATKSYGQHKIESHLFDVIYDPELNLWIATEVDIPIEKKIIMHLASRSYPYIESAIRQFTINLKEFLIQISTNEKNKH